MNMIPDLLSAPDLVVPKGYELIDGELVEKTMGAEAGVIVGNVTSLLRPHVSARKLGLVIVGEGGYQIFKEDPKKMRKPDISFIARGRFPNDRPPRGNVRIPPDLAIEVISPNDLAEDIEARVDDYLRAGTRQLWLLYPKTGAVWVVRQDGSGVRLKGAQELSGEDIIPDFRCQVQAFFADVEPS